jgi:hypothetical protein
MNTSEAVWLTAAIALACCALASGIAYFKGWSDGCREALRIYESTEERAE